MRTHILAVAVLAVLAFAALAAVAGAQTISLASDGGLVAPSTLTIIHINMTEAVPVTTASTVFVVANITIPAGFEVLYANITYNTSAAAPVVIKWDPVTRNMTVNVSVTSLPYNDLNITLVLLPVSPTANGTIAVTYYYNESTTYTAFLAASATLTVNASSVAAPYTPPAGISYGKRLCVIVAGENEAYALLQLLNDVQLSYVNGTLLNDTVLCAAANETLATSLPLLNISMPAVITASFGTVNRSAAAPAGLVLQSLPVYELVAPTSGSLGVVGVLGSTTTINYMEVNATSAFLVGGSAAEVHLNATTYMLVYGSVVDSLYLNATANSTEADILSSNVTSTLELVNASGVSGAKAYIAFSYVPAKFTSDTGWAAPVIVMSSTSILSPDTYGSNELVNLVGIYGTPSAKYAEVAVTLPPSAGSNMIIYQLQLGYDRLSQWYSGAIAPSELSGILVKNSYAEQTAAFLYATIPSSYVASIQGSLALPTASTVLAVEVGTSGASTKMYCCGSPVTSFNVSISPTTPVMLYLVAPAHKPEVEVMGSGIGDELVVIEADVGPSLLLPGTLNVTLESNATGATLTAAMVNLTGSLSYTGTPLVVSKLYGSPSSGVYNATITVYQPAGGVLYDGLTIYYELLVPNETAAYNLTLSEYFVSSATPVELTVESSTVYRVASYARMTGVYVPTPMAARLYLPLLAAVYNITPISYTGFGAAYAGNSTFTPYGKLLLLTDLPEEDAGLIEVKVVTADNRFALIGVGGVREVNTSIVNVTVPVKTCLVNVKLYAGEGVEFNSTGGYIPAVKILGSMVEAPVVAVNASTFMVKDSSISGNLSLAAEYSGVVVGGSLAGGLRVVNGTIYIFYANLAGVTSVTVSGGALKVYLPAAYSSAVQPYLVEPVTITPLATGLAAATGKTSVSVTAGAVAASAEFTTAPSTPTYLVAAQVAPMGVMQPPVTTTGSITVADVAVVGATPSTVYVTFKVSPSACLSYTAGQLASITKFYVYNATLGKWVEAEPAAVTASTTYCTVTAEFTASSTPPARAFTGVPVAAFTPIQMRVVGVTVYPFRLAVAAATAARLVYAAVAALLAAMLAAYIAARRL